MVPGRERSKQGGLEPGNKRTFNADTSLGQMTMKARASRDDRQSRKRD